MSYRKRRAGDKPGFGISRETLLLCGIFLIGGVFGSFFASGFELDTENFFSNYGSAVGLIMSPPFKLFFFYHAILLATIFFSVFMKWGMVFVAGALAIKGFSLSIAITCYIKLFGLKGYIPAFSGSILHNGGPSYNGFPRSEAYKAVALSRQRHTIFQNPFG